MWGCIDVSKDRERYLQDTLECWYLRDGSEMLQLYSLFSGEESIGTSYSLGNVDWTLLLVKVMNRIQRCYVQTNKNHFRVIARFGMVPIVPMCLHVCICV